ncbi:sorbitol dehydrogenase-like [Saccoglossus kowalevskii]
MAGESKNLAVLLRKKGDLEVVEVEKPSPGENEVLLAIDSVGICGTDVHFWTHGEIGDFIVKAPMILGHESSGVVAALGKGVSTLKVGDRVAIEPSVPCRKCDYCKGGRYNLCPDIVCGSTPPVHGSLANYYCHAADFCYKLPDHVSFEEGALLEPLSVGVHACRRSGVTLGSKLLVCGAGPIGLVSLLTAKAMGAAQVIITDIDQGRLDVGKQIGADFTVLADSEDGREMAKKIESTLGCMPDISIECSGVPSSIQTGIYATRSGGVFALVGLGPSDVTLPIVNAAVREVDIIGILRYANCFPTALAMIASGKVDVKPLVTHRFTLAKSLDAFETARTGAGGAIKVMIKVADK